MSGAKKRFEMEVAFKAPPVTIVVEADSLDAAWRDRAALAAAAAKPEEWETVPFSVTGLDDEGDPVVDAAEDTKDGA